MAWLVGGCAVIDGTPAYQVTVASPGVQRYYYAPPPVVVLPPPVAVYPPVYAAPVVPFGFFRYDHGRRDWHGHRHGHRHHHGGRGGYGGRSWR